MLGQRNLSYDTVTGMFMFVENNKGLVINPWREKYGGGGVVQKMTSDERE